MQVATKSESAKADKSRPAESTRADTRTATEVGPLWHELATLPLSVQPKLTVGSPDDPEEAEADRAADRVMRTVDSTADDEEDGPSESADRSVVRRQCAACEEGTGAPCSACEDETVRRESVGEADEDDSAGQIRMKSDSASSTPGGPRAAPAAVHSLEGGGKPLPSSSLSFFEPRFGRDFSRVRLHTGPKAAEAAQSIHARAFTFGNEIAFARDQWQPDSTSGRRLLAHELAHVVQRGRAPSASAVRRQPATTVTEKQGFKVTRHPDGKVEVEMVKGWQAGAGRQGTIWGLAKTAGVSTEHLERALVSSGAYKSEKDLKARFKVGTGVAVKAGKILQTFVGSQRYTVPAEAAKPDKTSGTLENGMRVIRHKDGRVEVTLEQGWAPGAGKRGTLWGMAQAAGVSLEKLRTALVESRAYKSRKHLESTFKTGTRVVVKKGEIVEVSVRGSTFYLLPGDKLTAQKKTVEPETAASLPNVTAEFMKKGWNEIGELGIVYQDSGANLRDQPLPEGQGSKTLENLKQSSKVWILAHNPQDKWFAVTSVSKSGAGGFGYVADWLIWRRLPEPQVEVHKIKKGETALGIAARKYPQFDSWGKDKRYIVNALVYVNTNAQHNGTGAPGLRKPDNNVTAAWFETSASADVYLWIPSSAHMNALYKTVVAKGGGTGSITADLWNKAKSVLHGVAYGLAFVGGLVHGFVKSLYDAVAGLIGMVIDVVVSIFTGNVVKDAKELWDAVSKITWKEIKVAVGDWALKWDKKLNSSSPWVAGHAHGYLTGYIMAEAAMLLISAGTLAAAKAAIWGSRLGKAIKSTRAFTKLTKGIDKARKAGGKVGEAFGKAGAAVRKTRLFKSLQTARTWAAKKLKFTQRTLSDLTLDAINRLAKLPDWALTKLRKLSSPLKRFICGCTSPCKVDPDAIIAVLKTLTPAEKAAAKALKSVDDIINALPKGIDATMIRAKLKKHKALREAITGSGLTDADFKALKKFLTGADAANPKTAYQTFTRYLTSVVPIKVGDDVGKLNALAAAMVKAQPRVASALKGPMFETWARLNAGRFRNIRFGRATFKSGKGVKLHRVRTSDGFIDSAGALWDFKHTVAKVPKKQAEDYFKILTQGLKSTDGKGVKSINYLFPDEAAAKANSHLEKMGFKVHYIKPPNTVTRLKP